MSKIMVVEDDASLREIYSIRITAEGYEVVSAGDGEEALAVAVREKPDLILSDVMMPKISGFDMLDILRSTPETSAIKVVMMTALSADDQRQRGERLGADRYLVKSQVGIEDVISTIHEVLGDRSAAPSTEVQATPSVAPAPDAPTTPEMPVASNSSDTTSLPTPPSVTESTNNVVGTSQVPPVVQAPGSVSVNPNSATVQPPAEQPPVVPSEPQVNNGSQAI